MRPLLPAIVILAGSAGAAHADGSVFASNALPPDAEAMITRIEAALDHGDVKALLATMSAKVKLDGAPISRAALRARIKKAGGLATWMAESTASPTWQSVPHDGGGIAISENGNSRGVVLIVVKVGRAWRLREIELPSYGTIGDGHDDTISGSHGNHGRTGVPAVKLGTPEVSGGLAAAVVARYVRRDRARLQYCYERELIASPGIAGTVTIDFTIGGGDGKVAASTASGVATAVSDCVAAVIKNIGFPKPSDGADVTVHDTFVFKATGK